MDTASTMVMSPRIISVRNTRSRAFSYPYITIRRPVVGIQPRRELAPHPYDQGLPIVLGDLEQGLYCRTNCKAFLYERVKCHANSHAPSVTVDLATRILQPVQFDTEQGDIKRTLPAYYYEQNGQGTSLRPRQITSETRQGQTTSESSRQGQTTGEARLGQKSITRRSRLWSRGLSQVDESTATPSTGVITDRSFSSPSNNLVVYDPNDHVFELPLVNPRKDNANKETKWLDLLRERLSF